MACIKDGKYCVDDYIKAEEIEITEACRPPVQHIKPKNILLECGCHPEDAIFDVDICNEKREQAFVLDKVIVDTKGLSRPLVKIEFSSLIVFEAKGKGLGEKEIEVELQFILERVCNGHKEIVQMWKYENEIGVKTEKLELEISTPFTVTFCEKTCPGCCEYKMLVIGKKFEGEFKELKVIKPDLSALAHGSCDD